jgi:hypothetical protein
LTAKAAKNFRKDRKEKRRLVPFASGNGLCRGLPAGSAWERTSAAVMDSPNFGSLYRLIKSV